MIQFAGFRQTGSKEYDKQELWKAANWSAGNRQTLYRFLSHEEAQGLVSVCDEHLKTIVICALNTGMKGEIFKLTWDEVDLAHGFVLLSKTKNGERREIPINDTLKAVFQRLPCRL